MKSSEDQIHCSYIVGQRLEQRGLAYLPGQSAPPYLSLPVREGSQANYRSEAHPTTPRLKQTHKDRPLGGRAHGPRSSLSQPTLGMYYEDGNGQPALLCEMRPTCSPHSDGDAGTAITVPLMLTGPTSHNDITILQLLCCLCRQPRATPPTDSRVN